METTKECKICKSKSKFIFEKLVLNKYKVKYFKCTECELIEPEFPYWLDEAYKSVIAELDIGALSRNIEYSDRVEKILLKNFDCSKDFLDYGGGYGLFTRLMRDKGFSFYSTDIYCENIFANYFDAKKLGHKSDYEVLTTFEVFEHLIDPINEIRKMLVYSDTILFSTELQPKNKVDEWWYIVPETGQHISLYSLKTLEKISKILNLNLYSKGNFHILTKIDFKEDPFIDNTNDNLSKNKPESLIWKDFALIKDSLSKNKEIINFSNNKIKEQESETQPVFSKEFIEEVLKINEDIKNKIRLQNTELKDNKLIFKNLENTIKDKDEDINKLKQENSNLSKELWNLNQKIYTMENSKGWRSVLVFRKIFHRLFPQNSFQLKVLRKLYFILKNVFHDLNFKKNNERVDKVERDINLNSKKIVYIGHSFHSKTKSTEFLINYLKEHFTVEVVLDSSWKGDPYPDLSFIDDSYLAVIFFQQVPAVNVLNSIKNDNLIFFPMFDSYSNLDPSYWKSLSKLKFVNFSKTLHDKLIKWDLDSMYIQYFPDVNEFIPGKENEIFFWQRISNLNFSVLKKLLGKVKFNIHIHKAVDPGHEFFMPEKEDIEYYNITFSDWFEKKSDFLELIKSKSIYFAPRLTEGIGQSFLEAMSMGKAVVAPDKPTMNEYITNNYNGYLYDFNNPQKINFRDVKKVQENAYKYMKEGNVTWNKEKIRIIDFIKKK